MIYLKTKWKSNSEFFFRSINNECMCVIDIGSVMLMLGSINMTIVETGKII